MAAATVTAMEWGYMVTSDTGVVTINAGKLKVKSIHFAGNADNATAALTSLKTTQAGGEAAVSCYKFKTNGNDLDASANSAYFEGAVFTGLAVTLSHGSDVLYVYVE